MKAVRLFAAALLTVAAVTGVAAQTDAAPKHKITRVKADAACVATCQAEYDARMPECLAIRKSGTAGIYGYSVCVAVARHYYEECVAACPA